MSTRIRQVYIRPSQIKMNFHSLVTIRIHLVTLCKYIKAAISRIMRMYSLLM